METIFYFDRIRIQTFEDPKKLKQALPLDNLAQHCKHIQIERVRYKPHRNGYSRLDIVAATPQCLKILYDNQQALGSHWISYVEIAKDQIHPTKNDAIRATYNFRARKKWAGKHWTYQADSAPDPNKFGLITRYTQSKTHGHVSYGRNCKINGQPCHHREWRIKDQDNISSKTGITEIGDLIAFNFPSFFAIHDAKYLIRNEKADQMKVGKWALGWSKRKHFTNREQWRIGCTGAAIIGGLDYGAFVQKLKQWKKAIKAKPEWMIPTEWDMRVMAIRDYSRFKSTPNAPINTHSYPNLLI